MVILFRPGKKQKGEELPPMPTDWPRIRFAASIAIYGAALGAASIIVNFLSQSNDPRHMGLGASLLFGTGGAVAGTIITLPFAFLLYGSPGRLLIRKRESRNLLMWIALGLGYGFFFPMVMGGFFLPMNNIFLDFGNGVLSVPNVSTKVLDLSTGLWPALAIFLGYRIFFTGIIAGVLFAPGAWVIDKVNASADPITARYGAWVVAGGLAALILAFAAFVPETTLAKLG